MLCAEVVLLTSDPAAPTDAREMLEKAAVLVGAANEVGIPNENLFLDPGLIHITHDVARSLTLDSSSRYYPIKEGLRGQ
ncbi:MAG: hypothetical protein Q7R57_09270 [Dehalococcoidales bacterium]|nr:hypothetical protein [Dehalococcoidales bacterium]